MDWLHCVPTQRRDPQRTWTSCICCDDCKAGWQEREDQLRAQNAKSCSQERDQRKKAEPEDPFSSSQSERAQEFLRQRRVDLSIHQRGRPWPHTHEQNFAEVGEECRRHATSQGETRRAWLR